MIEFEGVNSFLVGTAQLLIDGGRKRSIRGNVCYELPDPITLKINDPKARLVTIEERGWDTVLAYIESLWLGLGRNDLAMPLAYLNRMSDFSEDGKTLRTGYGPRLRTWQGGSSDYISERGSNSGTTVDQFRYVIEILKREPSSRQAILTLGDPEKDCFGEDGSLKRTLDQPCTRTIQFMINDNKLDTYVHMRSNDFIWGASGVNIFNFTLLQEIFAGVLGIGIGSYYHIANNFHYYERHRRKVEKLANVRDFEDASHLYGCAFSSLEEYDSCLKLLETYECDLRNHKHRYCLETGNDFLDDWANVIYSHYANSSEKLVFANPILNMIVKGKKI